MNRFLYRTYVSLNKIFTLLISNKQLLYTARYARPDEFKNLVSPILDSSSLLLGKTLFNHFLHVTSTENRKELGNFLVAAPTRGGKGLLAVSQLLTWKHSVIVNDIKGDLFLQTAGYRSTLGEVIVIDPKGYGHRFDPLEGKTTEDELRSSATHLLFHPDEGEGAIFTQRAITMLTQIFLAALAEGQPIFLYARKLINMGLRDAAERLHLVNPKLATKFLDVKYKDANFEDRFLLSAWGTLTARLESLLTETVVRSLTKSDFKPQELMLSKKPITIYLKWTEIDLLNLFPLVRLMWGTLIGELITAYDKQQGKNCKPVLLLIDEAGRTGVPNLSDHASTVCGRGLSLWIAVQDLSQLEAIYGKQKTQTLLNNCDTQIYYGPNDLDTAEHIEKLLGRKSDYAVSSTSREGTETSQGKSEQGIPLMFYWEIKQLKDEDILGFHRKLPPFKAKRMDWRQDKLLTKRQHIPPPKLSPLPELEDRQQRIIWTREKKFADGYLDDPDDIEE